MESRILGPIDLDGGAGGGAMEATIPFVGHQVRLRLEIDFPDRFTQASVDELDAALEHLDVPDRMAREAIAPQVERSGSAPAQLLSAWRDAVGNSEGDAGEFLRQLRPTAMTYVPDGGKANPYPLILRYGLADSSVSQEITVRFPTRPTGPEVERTLRSR